MTYSKKNFIIYFFLFAFLIFLDQLTKRFVMAEIGLNNSKQFLPGILNLTVVQNTGGAFSIFKEYPVFFKAIGIVNVFIFSYLVFCPTVKFNEITRLGCVFVLSGTTGNLIDRFTTIGVIDFLDLDFINFAVFNLADVFIDTGVVLILLGWLLNKKH